MVLLDWNVVRSTVIHLYWLRLKEVSKFNLMVNRTRLSSRTIPARPDPKNRSRYCDPDSFLVSAPNELKIYILEAQALRCAFFFNLQKWKKVPWNIFEDFPKIFLVRNVQKLLKVMYPGYQLHTLLCILVKRVHIQYFMVSYLVQ